MTPAKEGPISPLGIDRPKDVPAFASFHNHPCVTERAGAEGRDRVLPQPGMRLGVALPPENGGGSDLDRGPAGGRRLPPGYRVDLVSDPGVITLRRQDGSVVARFSARGADEEEIVRAAWADFRESGE